MNFKCPRCGGATTGDRANEKIACKSVKCGWFETPNERAVDGPEGPVTVVEPRGGEGGDLRVDPKTGDFIPKKVDGESEESEAKSAKSAKSGKGK